MVERVLDGADRRGLPAGGRRRLAGAKWDREEALDAEEAYRRRVRDHPGGAGVIGSAKQVMMRIA